MLGAVAGLPIGFVLYLVAREAILPTDLWSSDLVMWSIVGGTVATTVVLSTRHGVRPTRGGKIAIRSMIGFLIGAIVTGPVFGFMFFVVGDMMGVSQFEGAFAMGVAFTIVPIASLIGGLALAVYMGRRAASQRVSSSTVQ